MALPAGMSSCAMCVQIMSGTTTTWVDVSDNISVVESPTATKPVAEAYVFGETTPLTTVGKNGPVDLHLRGIWAEGTADPFYVVLTQFEVACGGKLAVRWAPAGCSSTHDAFSTSTTNCPVSELTYPGGDAASADVLMYEFTVHTPAITRAAWA
jgi:hypothetical protein